MLTKDLFRRLVTESQPPGGIWDSPAAFHDNSYCNQLLHALRFAQHTAQPDLDLVDRLSSAALEDILNAKRTISDPHSHAVLDFLHFDISILPLGLAASRKRLELMFVWIARSLTEQLEIGQTIDLDAATFTHRINPARSLLMQQHGHIAALEWLKLVYYYARASGGHRPLAESLYSFAVQFILRELPSEPAIEAAGSVLSWAVRAGKAFPLAAVNTLRRMYDKRECADDTHTMLGMIFALDSIPEFPLDRAQEAERVLKEHSKSLLGHETLQLLTVIIGVDPTEAQDRWSDLRSELTRYNAWLTSLEPDALLRRYEKERLFPVILPLIVTLIQGGRIDLATELFGCWTEIESSTLDENILFVMPTLADGVTYACHAGLVRGSSPDISISFRRLVSAINKFYGINIIVTDDQDLEPYQPERLGVPESDPKRSEELFSSVLSHYEVSKAAHFLRKLSDRQVSMRQLPNLPVPLQAVLLKDVGVCFPVSLSLQQPLPPRAVRKVLIWDGGTFQASRQSSWMKEVLIRAGVEVLESGASTKEKFSDHYASADFDVIWLLGHGEFFYESPHQSTFQLGTEEYASLSTWANWKVPQTDQCRLLVLDLCDSGTVATINGPGNMGLPALTARPEQSVIANQWPVHQFPSALFHLLLAHNLTFRTSFDAYKSALSTVAAGPDAIRVAMVQILSEDHEAVISFDRQSYDWHSILYWGAPAFYV